MMLVKASGKASELDLFIASLRNIGPFQPENAGQYMSDSMGFSVSNEENPYLPKIQRIEELTEISGVELKSSNDYENSESDQGVSDYIEKIENKLKQLHSDRKLLLEQIKACESGIAQYENFVGLGIPLEEIFSCEFISVRFGRIPKDNYEKLRAYEDNPYVLFIPCSSDSANYWGVYFVPNEMKNEIDSIFAFLYFERIYIPGAVGTIAQAIENIRENIQITKVQLGKIEKEISAFWAKEEMHCNEIYSRLKIQSNDFELRKFALFHNDHFYYVFWLLKNNLKSFKVNTEPLESITFEYTEARNELSRSKPPVKLKNNKFFKPFESFVSMYGLPSYDGIDITAFVALTYTLIFGIMFGDLGQGFVLSLAGLFMWKKKGMFLGKILIPCGVSSMFFGLVYGSFFGYEDVLDPLYKLVGLNSKPLEVMESINTVLLFAIGIGIFLVVAAMLLNVFTCIKSKRIGEAFFSQNGVAGIVFYIFAVIGVVGFMGNTSLLPKGVLVVGITLSLSMLFLKDLLIGIIDKHENWKPKGIVDFILQNFFEVFEYILSYFSNTVSFLRVGAFVLVHTGMMMVVFSLAGESRNIVIIVLGNILVIALEGLLTGIQVLRLEFYEMFSRFFEGEGRPFSSAEQVVMNKN